MTAPRVITSTDAHLAQISGQLDELIGILRPAQTAEPAPAPVEASPAAGEPEKPTAKKAAKKATTRRRVTGQ